MDVKSVCIVCGAGYVSGKEIMALELGEGLLARGVRVEYFTSSWHNGDFRRRLGACRIRYRLLPLGFISATLTRECLKMTGGQILKWPQLLLGYRQYLQRAAASVVVHTNWHHVLMLWPLLRVRRDIYWVHETLPDKPHYRLVFSFIARRLRCFVAVSEAVARSLRRLGVPEAKICVIHNGMRDPSGGQSSIDEGSVDRLSIGIVGQVGQWKGHEDLIDAFALLGDLPSAVELHVFGCGTKIFEDALKQRAESLGVSNQIVWHGFLADRREIYRQLDVCVVPSRSDDPLPTVAIEAAFCGLPVVVSRRGGLPEIVEDGVTGFVVDTAAPPALAAKLTQLLRNRGLRTSMGTAGRRRMQAEFSQNCFVGRFEALLASL